MFYTESIGTQRTAAEINTAMASVYKHMMFAVLTSMLVSYFIVTTPALYQALFGTSLKWVVLLAPIVAGFAVSMTMHMAGAGTALLMLHGFAALMGASMSGVFALYTSISIFTAFMGAAVLFGVMSFYGYFTKKDLSGWGKWMFVGLIAIIIASLINLFIGSTVGQTD